MQNKFQNKKTGGFTLIETLVGVVIFVLILGGVTLFSKNTWTYNSFIFSELEGSNAGRTALKNMIAEVRTASSGSNGAYAINIATANSLTFYSDIYDDGLKEKITYSLTGTTLQRTVTKPTGSPLGYTGASTTTNLVSNVTNATIFDYYDKNYDGTTAALPTPVDIASIRLIKMTITTDLDPIRAPSPITFTTQVMLRNLKDNL
ncbi:type II secretion system protein [Candidatus Nomurabacteria bacterium]|nr:type II secretion system protein [Candidatus Nomurabacteria bacterium]